MSQRGLEAVEKDWAAALGRSRPWTLRVGLRYGGVVGAGGSAAFLITSDAHVLGLRRRALFRAAAGRRLEIPLLATDARSGASPVDRGRYQGRDQHQDQLQDQDQDQDQGQLQDQDQDQGQRTGVSAPHFTSPPGVALLR